MSYRDDVGALAARHAALTAELAASSRLLADARERQKRSLSVVITEPCSADRNALPGDGRMRACGSCRMTHNTNGSLGFADRSIVSRGQQRLIALSAAAIVATGIAVAPHEPPAPPHSPTAYFVPRFHYDPNNSMGGTKFWVEEATDALETRAHAIQRLEYEQLRFVR